MKQSLLQITVRSITFNRKRIIYLVLIIALLSAVVTGSLLTGFSVRQNLKNISREKLGNTGFLISSGSRFFNTGLSDRVTGITGIKTASVLEIKGYCRNFSSGTTALNVNFYGISDSFFGFHGIDGIEIEPGTVAINEKLAERLDIQSGNEIIITYKTVSPIPSSLPFAPDDETSTSKVLSVSKILSNEEAGNFSLGISQIVPLNLFLNISDLSDTGDGTVRVNRLLIENSGNIKYNDLAEALTGSIAPEDIGLMVRKPENFNGREIISDRVFIDQDIVNIITGKFPESGPVITYLANSLSLNGKSTPYSFVSGLPESLYPVPEREENIFINRWLADDTGAEVGDTLTLKWYSPGSFGTLEEETGRFTVERIVDLEGTWEDHSLMPEFPGISGSRSCSDWDAGVALDMSRIRDKDEDYWNVYKGTPKAFISYQKAKELWGNNFGPATSIRFPEEILTSDIVNKLTGSFPPERSGFFISDPVADSEKAASESVDFSTLFLSLGFFIIVSCILLLLLSVTSYFISRTGEIRTLFAIGFSDRWISRYLLLEMLIISVLASVPGITGGVLFNVLIIKALNSVWSGAVQTDTLSGYVGLMPLIYSFILTVLISVILLFFKTRGFLRELRSTRKSVRKEISSRRNLVFLLISGLIAIILVAMSVTDSENSMLLGFGGGGVLFVTMLLLFRQFAVTRKSLTEYKVQAPPMLLSRLYYSFNPAHALTPVIFIAAGLFAVFITGSNRMTITDKMKLPSSGTGGYLIWGETAVPVTKNLGTPPGVMEFGLDDEILKDLRFVQGKVLPGDDASCLNLNHVSSPPILGINPAEFIRKGSFSFATSIDKTVTGTAWEKIGSAPESNTIFGIADQTVLEWGLKMKAGDTLKMEAENGQLLNIVIAAGLKSSLFQGYVLISESNFDRFFPSVSGYSVFLAEGKPEGADSYIAVLNDRFSNYGISAEMADLKLASFFRVNNTYLSVFEILGALGVFVGIFGLGFVLMRNYHLRKKEFALMLAAGFSFNRIKRIIYTEQLVILLAGVITGIVPAVVATMPSVKSGAEMPWLFISVVAAAIIAAGSFTLFFVTRNIVETPIVSALRRE